MRGDRVVGTAPSRLLPLPFHAASCSPLGQAIALDGTNHLYYSNRSICFAETGKLQEAREDGQKCVTIDPNFVKGECTGVISTAVDVARDVSLEIAAPPTHGRLRPLFSLAPVVCCGSASQGTTA